MLATRRTTGNDGLPWNVGDDPVRLDGRGQCRLEQHQHGAADRGGLAQEPAHDESWEGEALYNIGCDVKEQCYPKDFCSLGSRICGLYRREGGIHGLLGLHTLISDSNTPEPSIACVLPPRGRCGCTTIILLHGQSSVRREKPASKLLPHSGGRSLGRVGTGCGTRRVGPRPRRAWPARRVLPLREACQIRPTFRDGQDSRPGDGPVGCCSPCLDRGASLGSAYGRDLQARTRRTKPPCKLNQVLALLEADATYRCLRWAFRSKPYSAG
jgi:hypothetical protein